MQSSKARQRRLHPMLCAGHSKTTPLQQWLPSIITAPRCHVGVGFHCHLTLPFLPKVKCDCDLHSSHLLVFPFGLFCRQGHIQFSTLRSLLGMALNAILHFHSKLIFFFFRNVAREKVNRKSPSQDKHPIGQSDNKWNGGTNCRLLGEAIWNPLQSGDQSLSGKLTNLAIGPIGHSGSLAKRVRTF